MKQDLRVKHSERRGVKKQSVRSDRRAIDSWFYRVLHHHTPIRVNVPSHFIHPIPNAVAMHPRYSIALHITHPSKSQRGRACVHSKEQTQHHRQQAAPSQSRRADQRHHCQSGLEARSPWRRGRREWLAWCCRCRGSLLKIRCRCPWVRRARREWLRCCRT